MKFAIYSTLIILFFLASTGCKDTKNEKNNNNPTAIIAGDDNKTWKAERETDAEGKKDRLTRAEKKESITFFKNGNMRMGGTSDNREGTWSYNGNELSLQFTGENVSENFIVLELTNNKMKLRANDGSEMTMKPD
jgi:hypothetical protein